MKEKILKPWVISAIAILVFSQVISALNRYYPYNLGYVILGILWAVFLIAYFVKKHKNKKHKKNKRSV